MDNIASSPQLTDSASIKIGDTFDEQKEDEPPVDGPYDVINDGTAAVDHNYNVEDHDDTIPMDEDSVNYTKLHTNTSNEDEHKYSRLSPSQTPRDDDLNPSSSQLQELVEGYEIPVNDDKPVSYLQELWDSHADGYLDPINTAEHSTSDRPDSYLHPVNLRGNLCLRET